MDSMWFYLAIGSIAFFGFLAVSSWTEARHREREAFYRSETLRRFSEGNQIEMFQQFIAEEKAARYETKVQQRESLRVGGLVCVMTGIGFGILLAGLEPNSKVYLFGFVPSLAGLAILIYAYLLSPKITAGE